MFEIYGTTDCAYCDRAKILLAMKEKEYVFIEDFEDAEGQLPIARLGFCVK